MKLKDSATFKNTQGQEIPASIFSSAFKARTRNSRSSKNSSRGRKRR